jgi:hypothetical protein
MSTQLSTSPNETFQYTNRFLARTSELIKESNQITLELEELLHDVAKLMLTVAFLALLGLTLYDVLLMVKRFLFH